MNARHPETEIFDSEETDFEEEMVLNGFAVLKSGFMRSHSSWCSLRFIKEPDVCIVSVCTNIG